MSNNSITTIENKSQLIQYFIDGIKKNNNQRIGVEHEKFLFSKNDFKRIDYEKVKKIFEDHVNIVSKNMTIENHMMFLWQLVNLNLWMDWVDDLKVEFGKN